MPTLQQEKTYSIGKVAALFNVSVPTLRYYDSEGLIPHLERTASGVRRFSKENLDTINMIGCLKNSGMAIKDIKQFIQWCDEGDKTLKNRQAMFYQLKQSLQQQMAELQSMMDVVDFKCQYYDTAVKYGTEEVAKERLDCHCPEKLKVKIE